MEGLGTGLVDQWIAMNPPCLRQHRGFTQGSANDFHVLGVVRGRPVSMKHVIPRSQKGVGVSYQEANSWKFLRFLRFFVSQRVEGFVVH